MAMGLGIGLGLSFVSPSAVVYNINFGVKTRRGHGGYPVNQTAASAITGTGASDWVINSAGKIAPSGTYGNAMTFSKAAGETYNLTLADGTPCNITLVANAAHCTSTASDTSTSFELRTLLNTSGVIARGDTIYCRDDMNLNPTLADWRIRPPLAGYSGSGRVIVRGETPDLSTDSNGNLRRGGLARIGALVWDAAVSGDVLWPIDVYYLTFYDDNSGSSRCFAYTTASGFGLGAYYCRFETRSDVPLATANAKTAFVNRGGTMHACYVKYFGIGTTGGRATGDYTSTWTSNIFENLTEDGIKLGGTNIIVEDNFGFNFLYYTGAHPDWIQHLGTTTGSLSGLGSIRRNIGVRNVGPTTGDAQGIFMDDTTAPYYISGATIENNICIFTSQNGIELSRFDGATVVRNTILTANDNPFGTGLEPTLSMFVADDSGTTINSTFDRNASSAKSITGSGNTDTFNQTFGRAVGAYSTAIPGFIGGSNPGYVTRAIVLAALKPADLAIASGGLRQADDTFSGALFPDGSWNDGAAYVNGRLPAAT